MDMYLSHIHARVNIAFYCFNVKADRFNEVNRKKNKDFTYKRYIKKSNKVRCK